MMTCKHDIKILVADDDVVSRKKLTFLIIKMGYMVMAARDGREAWELWVKERPHLVFTDWYMPDIGGEELCRKIRAVDVEHQTYLIIVSAQDSETCRQNVLDAGADDFMIKPYGKKDLEAKIESVGKKMMSAPKKL